MARFLVETDVNLIIAQIKSAIPAALQSIRDDRADGKVTTIVPKLYYISDQNIGYQSPAVFVIADNLDFRLSGGQNFIDALVRINVSVVVEDLNTDLLTIKAYRYQAALFDCLNQVSLTNEDQTVKLIIKVESATFSPVYTDAQKKGDAKEVFRKEVLLRLEVEHYEQV